MLTKSKTTGKRGALGLAPSLMALSLAAFGVPAGALLVPSVALAADECGVYSAPENGFTDTITCGYNAGGIPSIDYDLNDPADFFVLGSLVNTGGIGITGTGMDPNEDLDVTIETFNGNTPSITNSTDGNGAFNITLANPDNDVFFRLNDGTLAATFAAGEGLYIETQGDGADIYEVVTLADTTITSALDDGIDLHTYGAGSYITGVNIAGDITAGNNGGDVALGAIVHDFGYIGVTLQGTADLSATGNGVEMQILNGGATVNSSGITFLSNGDITGGENGVFAQNYANGAIDITVADAIDPDNVLNTFEATIDADDDGIRAYAQGLGAVTVVTDADITAGEDGIDGSIFNTASTATIHITQDGLITADDDGIEFYNEGAGLIDGDIYGDITGPIYGVNADARGGGAIDLDTYLESDISASTYGIYANVWAAGANGALDIYARGDIETTSPTGAGIYAWQEGTNTLTVTTGLFSVITGDGDGINAILDNTLSTAELEVNAWGSIDSDTNDGIQTSNNGGGLTDINVYGDITAGNSNNLSDAGIQANATGTGGLDIYTGYFSDIAGTGLGIEARTNTATGATATLNILANGDIDTDFMEFYVNSNTTSGATVTVGEYSVINDSGDSDDLILDALGGDTTVNNYGHINGRVDLTGNDDTFNNYSSDTWVFTGTSDFGPGDDELNNIYTVDDDEGRIVNAVDYLTAETATYLSLENFNNGGIVSTVDQLIGDTFVRDRVYTSGNYAGVTTFFDGTFIDGLISLDAFLSDDTSLSDADRFIIGGVDTGYTAVRINDIATGFGALGDVIPVIEFADASGDGEFYLENGPIDKGLYSYDLYYTSPSLDPAIWANFDQDTNDLSDSDSLANDGLPGSDPDPIEGAYVLASYADASVNNLSAIPGIIAGNWNALAEGWLERSGDLRNYFMEPAGPLAYAPSDVILPTGETRDIGIWGRLVGLGGERTGSAEVEVLPDVFETFDTGYQEQLVGGQAGIDFAFHLEDSTVVFGLMGAYAQSEVAFNSGDTASLTTPSIGAYADWIMGGTYFNALAKVDFIGLDYDYGVDSDSTTGVAFGGALEAGHRFDFDSLFIEPVARVSYVETDLDTFNIGPDEVDLYGSSFQAKAGGRVGGTFATETYTVAPYLSGYVGYEFLGESSADIDALPAVVDTDFSGAFAEIGAGVNVDDVNGSGLTGFADANVVVAEDYLGASASVGLRANF